MTQSKQVCPGCTLLCDDIEFTGAQSERIARHACDKGQSYFQIETCEQAKHFVRGNQVELSVALGAAAKILSSSRAPLICGLDHLTTEAQQSAWKLADTIGAIIDSTMSNEGRASMFALQRIGKVTATIGEVANRSDVIVFWFCDPATSHPRLLERLNKPAKVNNRRIIVVDEIKTATAKLADQFIQIDSQSSPDVIAILRASLRNAKVNEAAAETMGVSVSSLNSLIQEMTQAKYGSVFFGQPDRDSTFDPGTDSMHRLIRELNNVTRFVGLKLRNDGNAQSAENVLAWSSGYPFAVNHQLKLPRYNWLEHSAETVLTRGECDAIVFATGVDLAATFSKLSRTAQEHLGSIPKISLSPIQNFPSDISFQVGVPGVNETGEFCRLDDVSLRLSNPADVGDGLANVILDGLLHACGASR